MRDDLLIQEQLERGPLYGWRMLACCILLNRTHGRQVRPMVREMFRLFPTPRRMAWSGQELEQLVRPLGLWRRRAESLRRMSMEVGVRRRHPRDCEGCGIGAYALDSWAIFVEGRAVRRPKDGKLREYARRMGWTKTRRSRSTGRRAASA